MAAVSAAVLLSARKKIVMPRSWARGARARVIGLTNEPHSMNRGGSRERTNLLLSKKGRGGGAKRHDPTAINTWLNAFATGHPVLGTNYLEFVLGRELEL